MSVDLELQIEVVDHDLPSADHFAQWVNAALAQVRPQAAMVIRVVGEAESREFNSRYRGIEKATNVLSFAADLPECVDDPLLGDLVVCAPMVRSEALSQGIPVQAHWAHLVIHGCLHLLGFDHDDDAQAAEMESAEITLLEGLGYPDPYTPTIEKEYG